METADKNGVSKIYRVIEEFRKLDPEIQAQTVITFLIVADKPGISVKEIGERAGIGSASASRNLAALSKVHRAGRPGHDLLVAREDPMDRRQKNVELTSKGKRVLETITEIMGK